MAAIEPFEIRVDDAVLDDLRARLARTRLPDQIVGTGWEYGIPSTTCASSSSTGATGTTGAPQEARLNASRSSAPRSTDQSIHFLHARSTHADALPLLLIHGWPGSIVEFLDVIPRLTDPAAHGGDADDAFHVIARRCPATDSPSLHANPAGTSARDRATRSSS